jgi:hypothetical protein
VKTSKFHAANKKHIGIRIEPEVKRVTLSVSHNVALKPLLIRGKDMGQMSLFAKVFKHHVYPS